MAKIVEVTNPVTGQPAQVDQLDHTAQQIDDGLNIARNVSNPNLLDNWYFGNPVDQRGGYVVPPGEGYYIAGTGTQVGATDSYYKVIRILDGDYPVINVGGTEYVTPPGTYVRGYIGSSDSYGYYTLDRWRVENDIVVTFESDGVSLENVGDLAGQYNQELPHDFSPEGTLLCISAMVKSVSGDARLFLSQSSSPFGHPVEFIPLLQPGLYSGFGNLLSGNHKFSIYLGAGAKIKLAAAKLELGSQQTLAHQDADGNWVLNEIPDYGEQLRRCQRYDYIIGRTNEAAPVGLGYAYSDTAVLAVIELPETMRANPAVSITGLVNLRFSESKNISVSNVSNYGFSGDKVQLFFDGLSGLTQGQSCDIYTQQGSKLEFNSNL